MIINYSFGGQLSIIILIDRNYEIKVLHKLKDFGSWTLIFIVFQCFFETK